MTCPPKSATYYYFALWRDDGTDHAVHDLLRCQAREKAGRREDPSAIILDTQSIRAANHVPAATTGKDADVFKRERDTGATPGSSLPASYSSRLSGTSTKH